MFKTSPIIRLNDGAAVALDAELMALAGVRIGDQLAATVDERGAIVLTPLRPAVGVEATVPSAAGVEDATRLRKAS